MAKDSLNLCRREGGEANSLRSNSLPSFSSLRHKFKAPSRAGYGHTVVALAVAWEHTGSCAVLLLRLGDPRFNFEVQNAYIEVLNACFGVQGLRL